MKIRPAWKIDEKCYCNFFEYFFSIKKSKNNIHHILTFLGFYTRIRLVYIIQKIKFVLRSLNSLRHYLIKYFVYKMPQIS